MLPQDEFSLGARFYAILLAVFCSLYFVKKKRSFTWRQKSSFNEDKDDVKSKLDVTKGTVKVVTDVTAPVTLKMVQRSFRKIINEIDSNSFKDVLSRHNILSSEFFNEMNTLPRRKRADKLLRYLLMSPGAWVPLFMEILERKYQNIYCSIIESDKKKNVLVTDELLCNTCTRKIIKYIINDTMQNANIPLDGGKLAPLLLEELIITPKDYDDIIIKKSLSKRTKKLQSTLDDDCTSARCLDVFKQAVKEAGYEDCHHNLENLMSEWYSCSNSNVICKGHIVVANQRENQVFETARVSTNDGHRTLIDIGEREDTKKTIIYKFEVNADSEKKHEQILRRFNAGKQSLNDSIKGLGEVQSITKGCIEIEVQCNQPDFNSENITVEIFNRMLTGDVPWEVLDNCNRKVQICVTDYPKGEDSVLLQKKVRLQRHILVILEEMDALDFEDAFTKAGLFEKEEFWKIFGIKHLSRDKRMLELVKFILKKDHTFVDHFIQVIMNTCGTTLLPLRESLSSIPDPNSAAPEVFDEIEKPHKSFGGICQSYQENHDKPGWQQSRKDFAAYIKEQLNDIDVAPMLILLVLSIIVILTVIVTGQVPMAFIVKGQDVCYYIYFATQLVLRGQIPWTNNEQD